MITRTRLLLNAVCKLLAGMLMIGLLTFLPAGTIRYPNAWLLIAVLGVPMLIVGALLFFRAPELLAKRLNHRERESAQRGVVGLSGLMFLVGFVLAGLDFRFGWTPLPGWLVGIAAAVFLLGYGMFAEVLRENAYLSRTIEVQEDQKVIDSGLYGVVRHPMYSATLLMFLSMPLILGSGAAFIVFLFYPLLIAKRIQNEEAVLESGLAGYSDYKRRVKYRLIPHIW